LGNQQRGVGLHMFWYVVTKYNIQHKRLFLLDKQAIMSLALQCVGFVPSSEQGRVVQVYAKLGGKHLGTMVLPRHVKQDGIVAAIRSLQRQGAALLPHHERPCQYLQVFVDNKELPSMTYRTNRENLMRALDVFDSTKTCLRVDLAWQEDDDDALSCIQDYFAWNDQDKSLHVFPSKDMPNELCVLEFYVRPTKVSIRGDYVYSSKTVKLANLDFLRNMVDLEELHLGYIIVESCEAATKIRIKKLRLLHSMLSDADLLKFQHLEHLEVKCSSPSFKASTLTKLPRLKTVGVDFARCDEATWLSELERSSIVSN
jgi:hypothetical protein